MRRPRILLMSPLPPPVGGIPTWTLAILGSPLRDRFEFRVVDTSPARKTAVAATSRFRPERVLDALRIWLGLIWELIRFRPDVVHVNTPYFWAFARDGLSVWMSSMAGARTTLHFRGGEFPEWVEEQPAPLRHLIAMTLRRTDRLIALTRHSYDSLCSMVDQQRVRYVPNFVLTEDFDPLPDRHHPPRGALHVLFVGYVLEAKGVGEILEAARAFPDVQFTLVGPADPSYLEAIRPLLEARQHHVRLLPPAPRSEVLELYRAADVFVLPTYREGFPNVILEAMAAGLPIITTPVGAIPEMIRDGEEGILVPPRDAAALEAALRRLIESPALRRELGARARKRVESDFRLEAVADQLASIYSEILA